MPAVVEGGGEIAPELVADAAGRGHVAQCVGRVPADFGFGGGVVAQIVRQFQPGPRQHLGVVGAQAAGVGDLVEGDGFQIARGDVDALGTIDVGVPGHAFELVQGAAEAVFPYETGGTDVDLAAGAAVVTGVNTVDDHTHIAGARAGQEVHAVGVVGCAGKAHIAQRHGEAGGGHEAATAYRGDQFEVVGFADREVQLAALGGQGGELGAAHIGQQIDLGGRSDDEFVGADAVGFVEDATDGARRDRNRAADHARRGGDGQLGHVEVDRADQRAGHPQFVGGRDGHHRGACTRSSKVVGAQRVGPGVATEDGLPGEAGKAEPHLSGIAQAAAQLHARIALQSGDHVVASNHAPAQARRAGGDIQADAGRVGADVARRIDGTGLEDMAAVAQVGPRRELPCTGGVGEGFPDQGAAVKELNAHPGIGRACDHGPGCAH